MDLFKEWVGGQWYILKFCIFFPSPNEWDILSRGISYPAKETLGDRLKKCSKSKPSGVHEHPKAVYAWKLVTGIALP